MDSPSEMGAAAEREVAYALMRAGWSVFAPVFDSHGRVDLIALDPSGAAARVQVKHGRLVRAGSVLAFRTCSNTNNTPVSYDGQVDFFGVWSDDLDRVYLVPADDVPTRLCHLRLEPPANGQTAGVRFAASFEVSATS